MDISIIGLGQIGGSLVLALRDAGFPCRITGIDLARRRLKLLGSQLDTSATSWKAAREADLVIVCLHYRETVDFLADAPPGILTMDVCSGKEGVVRMADRLGLRFVGGHPMAGNERPGEKGWDAKLFGGAPFFLCPSEHSTTADLKTVRRIVRAIGARPLVIDAAVHDRHVAITSHLPAFLSCLLAEQASTVPAKFKGPGFASMTRLARTSPELLETFLESNGPNIAEAAERLAERITQQEFRQCLVRERGVRRKP